MLYSGLIIPTRCNNCVFILRNGFTLHVSGDNLTHHQDYICCIWPQVSRLTYAVSGGCIIPQSVTHSQVLLKMG